jgi:FixJ family two-component response regulator
MATLTVKERDVLKLVVQGKHNKEIARIEDVSVRTVELRRARLMKKLKAGSLVELLHMALTVSNGGPFLVHGPHLGLGNGQHHYLG